VKRYLLFFALLAIMPLTVGAQSFRVSVGRSADMGRGFVLYVYDTDSMPRVLKPEGNKKGQVTFAGTVRGAVYAELRHPKVASPLPFFLENSDISINFNPKDPEQSHITGSRQNSVVRYQLEQCGEMDAGWLAQFVAENPSSPVAPFILERYVMPASDLETTIKLYGMLSGEACKAWHYRHLGSRLKIRSMLADGEKLPTLTYADKQGRVVRIDTLVDENRWNVIAIGASFCRQCKTVVDTIAMSMPELKSIVVDIDNLTGGWDAPLLQQLDADHIPYLVLIAPDRRIAARDARVWELKRIIGHDNRRSKQ